MSLDDAVGTWQAADELDFLLCFKWERVNGKEQQSVPEDWLHFHKRKKTKSNNVLRVLVGVSLSLHGSELQHHSLHRHRVQLQPSASGYRAADRPLAFPSCGEDDIMEESLATAPDSSTQDDVPPLGEHQQQEASDNLYLPVCIISLCTRDHNSTTEQCV